jgi:hypothetical protein
MSYPSEEEEELQFKLRQSELNRELERWVMDGRANDAKRKALQKRILGGKTEEQFREEMRNNRSSIVEKFKQCPGFPNFGYGLGLMGRWCRRLDEIVFGIRSYSTELNKIRDEVKELLRQLEVMASFPDKAASDAVRVFPARGVGIPLRFEDFRFDFSDLSRKTAEALIWELKIIGYGLVDLSRENDRLIEATS